MPFFIPVHDYLLILLFLIHGDFILRRYKLMEDHDKIVRTGAGKGSDCLPNRQDMNLSDDGGYAEETLDDHILHLIDFAGIPMFSLDTDSHLLSANNAWISLHVSLANAEDVLGKAIHRYHMPISNHHQQYKGYHDAVQLRLGRRSSRHRYGMRTTFLTYTVTMMPKCIHHSAVSMTGILSARMSGSDTQASDREPYLIEKALTHIANTQSVVPICASCKRVRDREGYWNQLERIISEATSIDFSHSICPDCSRRLYPDLFETSNTDDKT